jgi:hypothetical protein
LGSFFYSRCPQLLPVSLLLPALPPCHQFLQFYDTTAAPFGGPIALVPKHPRPSSIDPFLRIFNACGVEIQRYNWYDDHVKALGWSNDEDLFCVLRDGRIMQ